MKKVNQLQIMPITLTFIRILTGWHFLYEGIIKLVIKDWSSYIYLSQSKWILSDLFGWIMANPTALAIVDFLNIWGLILIGLGLFFGIFTRIVSISGIVLLALYYIVAPPFIITSPGGNFFIVNYQIIEAGILLVFALLPKDYMLGADKLLKILALRKNRIFPDEINHEIPGTNKNRREFVKNLAVLPVFGGVFFGMAKKVGWFSFEEDRLKVDALSSASIMNREVYNLNRLEGRVPMGRIGNLKISRMLPGGNLVSGFAHARDLIYVSNMIKQYHTDEKVIETLWRCEDVGINTVQMRTDEQIVRILREFWRRGGKLQWLAQTNPRDDDFSNIQMAIDNGAVGCYVQGGIADRLVTDNRMESLAKPFEYIKSQGLPAGIGAHLIDVPKRCIEYGINPDFFMKTLHHDHYWSAQHERRLDNIWCDDAEETIAFFKNCNIPWIAFKVLAAGAIKPEEGFRYAFENGADFICVGMFDFQVIDNANFVHNILSDDLMRERRWLT